MRVAEYLKAERADIAKYVVEKYASDEADESSSSPSGKYRSLTKHYVDSGVTAGGGSYEHSYFTCIVLRAEIEIFRFNGTTAHFLSWVEVDSEQAYLVCSEHYQGYGILDLSTQKYNFHLPEEALDGTGFIWTNALFSPDFKRVAVDGCVWAAPYQIKVFAVDDIMSIPYKEIFETSFEFEYKEILGWMDAHRLKVLLLDGSEYIIEVQ